MREISGENEEIKNKSAEHMVVLLEKWKQRRKRHKIYRVCLLSALIISLGVLGGVGYYLLDGSIPSTLYVRRDKEQSFHLGVPATADIVSVGQQGKSNIPEGAVTIDLSKPVTLRTGGEEQYSLQVKLFGFLPFKQVGIHVVEEQELIPVGVPVGIYVKTDGILVIGEGEFENANGEKCSPSKGILKSGDYIREMNGQAVSDKDDFIKSIEEGKGEELFLTIERDGKQKKVSVKPVQAKSGNYKIGVWVRDNAQGVGTMTYIDAEGQFGALGHGINDVDTSTLMQMNDGTLYQTEIVKIQKGDRGKPGEMTGMIAYVDSRVLGDITTNSMRGIFGVCNQKAMNYATQEPLPIAFKQEIQEGPAQILCTIEEEPTYYDVEITAVHLTHDKVNRGIELKVMDEKLLELTGGIVQGMSGSPIIQDGKIIGAVTHVLVNDPTRGYGIFIENMLEH